MTWKDLLDKNLAERHKTSTEELADLRNAVERNLDDAAVSQLSADNRFGLAYEGALLLAIHFSTVSSKAVALARSSVASWSVAIPAAS